MSRIESPDAQLVELLRRSDTPAEEDMRRVREALGVRLALGAAASTALLAASHSSWASRLSLIGSWGKAVFVASSVVGITAGAVWYLTETVNSSSIHAHTGRAQSVLATRANEPGHAIESVSPVDDRVELRDAQSGSSEVEDGKARAASGKTPSRVAANTLEAELQLLGKAQSALKSGQPSEALRALDEHARRFPSGVLAAERTGVRPIALCQAGRLDEGRNAARSYLRLVPNSVLSNRIRVACQLPGE